MAKNDQLLMIFAKNPEKGRVKTRLAKTVGEENALKVYNALIKHTKAITLPLDTEKAVFYDRFIDLKDLWDNLLYQKHIQEGDDLGQRMANAFTLAFANDYKRVIIIGSDCLELTTDHLDTAFDALKSHDVVIGPAHDGGYYLLGMSVHQNAFFENKVWSTENVFVDTLLDIKKLDLSYHILETLSDVDYEDDLGPLKTYLR